MRRVALALLALATAAGCGAPPPPRNILLITIDTLRPDRLGAYGSKKGLTPTLDALAAEGTVFEKASTTIPLTGPSHSGMLTGRYPIVTGFRNNGTAMLPPSELLMPEILKANGFATAAVVSCLVLSSDFGFNQGFDLYYEEDITSKLGRGMWFEERKADKTVNRALQWVESQPDNRPIFLWMHLFDPHHPYDPPGSDPNLPMETRYDAEVAFVDRELARFRGEMIRLGRWDDSLVLVAGDHGESLGEHGEKFHGIFVYDATMHVPLIARLPGAPRGRRVADQASLLDLLPTVVESLHLPEPATAGAPMQGVSLLPAIAGSGRVPARDPYLESIYGSTSYGWAEISAIRTPRWKFISVPSPELYDMEADPGEKRNLFSTEPARAEEVATDLSELRSGLEALKSNDTQAVAIDDEMRERLFSLGYIAGTESKLRQGQPRDAKEVIEVAEGITFAGSLMGHNLKEEAERVLREVVRLDPENKLALTRLGRLLANTKRLEEGLTLMRRAIEIYPDSEEIYRGLGWMLINNGRIDEAIELFSAGLQAMPASGSLLYVYGYAHFRAGHWEKGLEALGEALRVNPREAKALYLSGLCQEKLGRRDAALASLEAYLKQEPDVESLFRDPYLESLRSDPRFAPMVKRYL